MHINLLSPGRLFMMLSAACILTGTAHAAESASFRFDSDPLNTAQAKDGVSDSYRWKESAVSWQPLTDDRLRESGNAAQESALPTDAAGNSPENNGGGRRAAQETPSPQPAQQNNPVTGSEEQPSPAPIAQRSPTPSPPVTGAIAPAETNVSPSLQGLTVSLAAVIAEPPIPHPFVSANILTNTLPEARTQSQPPHISWTAQLLNAAMPASMTTGTAAVMIGLIGLGSLIGVTLLHRRAIRQNRLRGPVRRSRKRVNRQSRRRRAHAWRMAFLLILLLGPILPSVGWAQSTVPQQLRYSGRLYDAAGTPVTAPHIMRFSFWTSEDAVSSDATASGTIAVSAPTYAGWQEEQTVTPDSSGQVNVELGSITALPDFGSLSAEDLLHLSLQVEVKAAGATDTAFELLDPNSTDAAEDRFSLLSVPFALNAGMLDRREVGTGSGAIPLLGSGGLLPPQHMGAGTNQTVFTLNAQNSAADAVLTFGNNLLAETLKFSAANHRFEFSDSVHVENNLTASGTVTVQGNARFNSSVILNSVAYRFPASDGTASGKVLKTSGSGQLSWSDDDNAPDTAAFSDMTTESLTDANVDLWDGTYPNITLAATTHTVLVNVVVGGTADAGDNESDAFTIHRAINGNPTCLDTIVGGVFSGTPTTRNGDTWSASTSFLDVPATTGNVRYTVCSNTAATTGGTVSNDTSGIWVSLIELGN